MQKNSFDLVAKVPNKNMVWSMLPGVVGRHWYDCQGDIWSATEHTSGAGFTKELVFSVTQVFIWLVKCKLNSFTKIKIYTFLSLKS